MTANSTCSFRFLVLLIAGLSLASMPQRAQAATVEWTLNNAGFVDGDLVSGSFVWDTDLQDPVSWNFSVAGGGNIDFLTPFTYSDSESGHDAFAVTNSSGRVLRFDSTELNGNANARHLRIGIENFGQLDTPVAMLALSGSGLAPTGLRECYNCFPTRNALEGAFLSSVIPIPATFWLFGTALVGFIALSRRGNIG